MLDPHPRAQLCLIIQQYGQNIIAEPKRCRGMLSDLAPHHRLEINLLIAALEQKVAQELLQPSALIPINMQIDRLVKRLHDVVGIKEEFAYWAVESWALALGVNQSTVKTSSTPQPIKEEKSYSVEGVRKKHPNAYAKWSAFDDDSLRKKYAEGSTISELAKLLHRTEGAIQSRLTKLNVQPPLPTKTIPPSSTAQQRIGKFIVQDGVATDTETDLMWCRFAHGQVWQNGTAVGDAEPVKWLTAFDVAKRLNQQGGYAGYTDWRLPTIDELKTLIDKKLANYINVGVFPNNTVWFWSSSPINGSYSQFAWAVNFKYGNCNNTSNGAVRLVRGGVHKVATTPSPTTVKTQIPTPVVATNPSPTTVSPLIAKLGLRQVTPTSLQHTPVVVTQPPIMATPPPVAAKTTPTPVVAIPSTATLLSRFFAWWIAGFIFIAIVYISSGSQSENNNAPEQLPVTSVPTLIPPQAVTRCFGNCTNGQGTINYANGDKYVGAIKNNKADGHGTFTYQDGSKYVGEFKNDKFDGQGTLAYADGNKYVGEFKNDKVNGQGILTYADGSQYVGEFKNGQLVQKNPQVTQQTDNSKLASDVATPASKPDETHSRCIKGNCVNGHGTQTYPDGSKYIGQFKNGLSDGQGTLIFANGEKFVGKFKQDRFQR